MADFDDREHFIPLRSTDLVQLLVDEKNPLGGPTLSEGEQHQFRQFSRLVGAHFHQHFHQQMVDLKDAYTEFDPDRDTRSLKPLNDADRATAQADMLKLIDGLLQKANYTRLNREEIQEVMDGASDWGIDMEVDWSVFDELEVYYRGDMREKRIKRSLMTLFRKREREVKVFRRMVVILKQNDHPRLGPTADTRNIFLKLFKDIPQVDLEMVLPGTRMKMPKLERGKLIASLISTVAMMIWKIFTTVTAVAITVGTLFSLTFLMPLAVVVGYGYKQYSSYQVTKQTYQFRLTQTLYFQTLDNNAGVLFRLLDEAEEQECREAILAYFYLWRYAGSQGWSLEALDDYIELELEKRLNLRIDFEISDAMEKLERIGLVEKVYDRYRAIPLDEAVSRLQQVGTEQFQTV
ncbi:DUF3754 domain-containing protein [Tuwongella immobilis]|uniref:DUF3754 domain-containing protein n=1 Tax=Tuwongella immobilis TaxID=692036 RepID=A0A6C2YS21_9BACT|nr:DUF3754 domain-containing protein [Tuwongella immobilis]VIP03923.1 Uncharacterized protein OS=Pirellula staleyi (strain ATCC 27377 / DSM 6068 / ICPB 4128) GN=Psta_4598 PE=4 SV=1: DUF3754 [Tuwongella immobilis]VTS05213.1 Uncharacterized protein OS=Pirellula staleyi (strain ATCC 27377 / DSM 6068 / ICPB 4128) GN=Psta_4598 PE=4 SV=1: DUF3754 [Tuwongella immobilis]